jgi:hypothetical protein
MLEESLGTWLAAKAATIPGVKIPRRDLDLLNRSVEKFMLTKVALVLLGLFVPAYLTVMTALIGVSLPFVLPAVFGLALGGYLWFLPDLDIKAKAHRARLEFGHAADAYLDLVALKRIGEAGTTEALEQAAQLGHGWAFERLQSALLEARLNNAPPWDGLRELADRLDLPDLNDVADIGRLSGTEGARIYATLRARAKSVRTRLLTAEAEQAKAAVSQLEAPAALLLLVMLILIGYPLFSRILST